MSGNDVTVGSLALTNDAGYPKTSTLDTGSTTVGLNGDVTSVNSNATLIPAIKGRLNLNGVLPFNIGGSAYAGLDVLATMGSSGGISKSGAAALLLETNNTFTGAISVNQGILDLRHPNALGSTAGSTTLTGNGSLTLRNVTVTGETLVAQGNQPVTAETIGSLLFTVGAGSWNGPIQLDTNLVVGGNDATLGGPISGPGGLDFRTFGTAIINGSGGNSFTGSTLVRCPLLELNKPSGVNACAGPLIVGGGAGGPYEARWLNSYQNPGASLTLYANGLVNLTNHNEDFGPVTFNGGEVDSGTGQFAIYAPLTVNPAASSAVINGYLGLPPGGDRVFIVGDGAADCDLLVNAVIFGTPNAYFVKQGAGKMCLTAANTFDAVTLLEEGILDISNPSGLGTAAGTVVFGGATLRLSGSGAFPEGLELVGAGVGGTHGAIEVSPGVVLSLNSDILLDAATTFNVGAGSTLTLAGSVQGNGPLIKSGTGTLGLGGGANNTYSGDTLISGGLLSLAKSANAVSVPGKLVIGPASALEPASARLFQNGGLGGSSVTVNANSLFALQGYSTVLTQLTLNDGGSVQTGVGTLTLADGATVTVGSLNALGSHASSSISGKLELPIGLATFFVSPHAPTPPLLLTPELDVPAVISGGTSGQITVLEKDGLGQMQLGAINTFYNQVRIYEGTLIAANGGALGNAYGGTFVYNGATLALDHGVFISESLVLDSTNAAALASWSGTNTWAGGIYLNRNSNIRVDNALSLTGVIDGPGSLTETGLGSLTLGGSSGNTYSGETFVNQGTLLLNKPIAVTAVPGALEVGALDGSTAGTVRNLSSYQIVGNILVHQQGLYDVNGQQENVDALLLYGGGTVQTSGGYLSLKTGGAIHVYPGVNTTAYINGSLVLDPGNHLITVGSGATLPGVFDAVINATVSETSPSGSIQKEGAGRLRLGTDNLYTGSTVVNAGTLQVDGSQPQSAVQVAGGTLQGGGTIGSFNFTGSSGVVAPGASPGMLTCSNFNAGAPGSGTLAIELNGTTPGVTYDQVNARGTVTLTGIMLSAFLNFESAPGDQFTIISNDGVDAVIGTFVGLPQGTNFSIGSERFQISYTGGSGNDVVLTHIAIPIAQWNFNSPVPDGNTTTGTIAPSFGNGAASLIGGTSQSFAGGSSTDPASSGTDNSGWNTASYPPQGTGNKTGGAQFSVSTVGWQNVIIRWDQRVSNTGSKYARLQYTTDGTTFSDFPGATVINGANSFESKTNSLAAIPLVSNNPNFAFRIVSEFESTAANTTNAVYDPASNNQTYGTNGTIRFDMVTVSGTPLPPVLGATPSLTNHQLQLTLSGISGASYIIEASTDLTGNWVPVATNVAPFAFVEPDTSLYPQRFYRARAAQ